MLGLLLSDNLAEKILRLIQQMEEWGGDFTWFILCFSASLAANISDTFTPENGFFFCLTFFLVESEPEMLMFNQFQ